MDAYKKSRVKSIICWVIAFALAIFYLVVSFLPFIFMVLNSFKEKFEMLTVGVFELPQSLNFANYQEVLTGGFGKYFMKIYCFGIEHMVFFFCVRKNRACTAGLGEDI